MTRNNAKEGRQRTRAVSLKTPSRAKPDSTQNSRRIIQADSVFSVDTLTYRTCTKGPSRGVRTGKHTHTPTRVALAKHAVLCRFEQKVVQALVNLTEDNCAPLHCQRVRVKLA